MAANFLNLTATPSTLNAQRRYYGRTFEDEAGAPPPELGPEERAFIAARDSFYLASVTESGWPYVQHRGGPVGFLRPLGPRHLVFADFRGNRQMLTTGNVAANDRVALLLMDYPQRSRLKILGHAKIVPAVEAPEVAAQVAAPPGAIVERLVTVEVAAFDWNCPKFITPRYTKAEVEELLAPLRARIAELERRR